MIFTMYICQMKPVAHVAMVSLEYTLMTLVEFISF